MWTLGFGNTKNTHQAFTISSKRVHWLKGLMDSFALDLD